MVASSPAPFSPCTSPEGACRVPPGRSRMPARPRALRIARMVASWTPSTNMVTRHRPHSTTSRKPSTAPSPASCSALGDRGPNQTLRESIATKTAAALSRSSGPSARRTLRSSKRSKKMPRCASCSWSRTATCARTIKRCGTPLPTSSATRSFPMGCFASTPSTSSPRASTLNPSGAGNTPTTSKRQGIKRPRRRPRTGPRRPRPQVWPDTRTS